MWHVIYQFINTSVTQTLFNTENRKFKLFYGNQIKTERKTLKCCENIIHPPYIKMWEILKSYKSAWTFLFTQHMVFLL